MIVVQPSPPFVPMPGFLRSEPPAFKVVRRSADTEVGEFFTQKYREQARAVGYQQAAKNLRKQGVPLEVARLVLLGVR